MGSQHRCTQLVSMSDYISTELQQHHNFLCAHYIFTNANHYNGTYLWNCLLHCVKYNIIFLVISSSQSDLPAGQSGGEMGLGYRSLRMSTSGVAPEAYVAIVLCVVICVCSQHVRRYHLCSNCRWVLNVRTFCLGLTDCRCNRPPLCARAREAISLAS